MHGSEITTVSRTQKDGTSVPVSSHVVVVVVVVVVVDDDDDDKHADLAGHADHIQVVYGFDHNSEKWCGLY